MNEKDKLIGSLAILKSGLIEKDFISTYVPFVAAILLDIGKSEEGIKVENICTLFEKYYGFTIDRAPMVTVLNKCSHLGLVEKCRNGKYVPNIEKCAQKAISENEVARRYQENSDVIIAIKNYYKEKYNIEEKEEAIEDYFLKFLSENSAKTLIVDFKDNKQLPETRTHRQNYFIISNFIYDSKNNNPKIFSKILNLATAYLMSSAIAYGDKDERTQIDAFKNLVIYLDTPLVIRLLGLNGKEYQDAIKSLLDQLKSLGANFYIFSHDFDELKIILSDCLRWINEENYNQFRASLALRTFVERKFTKNDIQEYIDTLENKLQYYSIEIDDRDYYVGKYYSSQIDDKYIEDQIIAAYKESNPDFNYYYKKLTIETDVKSISAIFKLWNNRTARTYRQAKYVFLTNNVTLALSCRRYILKYNRNCKDGIYPCITDVFLGTNIWLSAPVKKIESFSQKKLMADCMSMIEPSESLLQCLQQSIEKAKNDETITKQQYYLLKYKAYQNDYLTNKTLNDETAFDDRITESILEDIENEIKAPLKKQIKELQIDKAKNLEIIDSYTKQEEVIKANEARYKENAIGKCDFFSNVVIVIIILPALTFLGTLLDIIPTHGMVKPLLCIICAGVSFVLSLLSWRLRTNGSRLRKKLIKHLIKRQKIKDIKIE
jgi:hypothetical protein